MGHLDHKTGDNSTFDEFDEFDVFGVSDVFGAFDVFDAFDAFDVLMHWRMKERDISNKRNWASENKFAVISKIRYQKEITSTNYEKFHQ